MNTVYVKIGNSKNTEYDNDLDSSPSFLVRALEMRRLEEVY